MVSSLIASRTVAAYMAVTSYPPLSTRYTPSSFFPSNWDNFWCEVWESTRAGFIHIEYSTRFKIKTFYQLVQIFEEQTNLKTFFLLNIFDSFHLLLKRKLIFNLWFIKSYYQSHWSFLWGSQTYTVPISKRWSPIIATQLFFLIERMRYWIFSTTLKANWRCWRRVFPKNLLLILVRCVTSSSSSSLDKTFRKRPNFPKASPLLRLFSEQLRSCFYFWLKS